MRKDQFALSPNSLRETRRGSRAGAALPLAGTALAVAVVALPLAGAALAVAGAGAAGGFLGGRASGRADDAGDSVADLVRHGRDLETVVLARAVRAHLEHRTLVHGSKTIVFA